MKKFNRKQKIMNVINKESYKRNTLQDGLSHSGLSVTRKVGQQEKERKKKTRTHMRKSKLARHTKSTLRLWRPVIFCLACNLRNVPWPTIKNPIPLVLPESADAINQQVTRMSRVDGVNAPANFRFSC